MRARSGRNRILIGCLLLFAPAAAQDLSVIRHDLETAAGQIDLLSPLAIGNYGRTFPREPVNPDHPAAARLAASNYPSSSRVMLLADASPRVRTLVLELLFRKEDPHLLPFIFASTTDAAKTFDTLVEFPDGGPSSSRPKRRVPQTVADFAKAMTDFYGVRGDFREYWAARKDRTYWFTLLQSQMWRITGRISPVQPGARAGLQTFREMLGRLPYPNGDLYLIWLHDYTNPAFADDAELAKAVRRLGRRNVLAIAEGRPPGGDPDLQLGWDPGRYRANTAVILRHAQGVLLPEDAPRLAETFRREWQRVKLHPGETYVSSAYLVAQARLIPDRAQEILRAGIALHNEQYWATERGELAAALLQLCGVRELAFLRDFFYGESPVPGYGLESQRSLIYYLASEDRDLLEVILGGA